MSQYVQSLFLILLPIKVSLTVLTRNKWHLFPIYEFPDEFNSLIIIKKHKLRFSKEFELRNLIKLYVLPKNIFKNTAKMFMVYNIKHNIVGVLMKDFQNPSSKNLYFLRTTKYYRFIKCFCLIIRSTIEKLDIENKEEILYHLSNISKELETLK